MYLRHYQYVDDEKRPSLNDDATVKILWSVSVMELLRKDGFLHILNEEPPDPESATVTVVNKFRREDQKAPSPQNQLQRSHNCIRREHRIKAQPTQ